jgi:predicted phage terminase large subunit-like protein
LTALRAQIQAEKNRREAERCRASLAYFIRQAWHVLEPATTFADNWHIDAIAEHLQAVTAGEIRKLLINMPPRGMKSRGVAVFWPTWEWATKPHTRWLFASYAADLSTRDSLACRRLIESAWYQSLFGDVFRLTSDQNVKSRFENDRTGIRIATSVGAATTGEGGDRLVIDDPHNVKDIAGDSDAKREAALTWYKEAWSTRGNDPKTATKVIVMQRLHERDLSGFALEEEGGFEHLCLPMRYEPKRFVFLDGRRQEVETSSLATSIGFTDPRTTDGELLHPDRFGEEQVAALEKVLGSFGAAGQLQQRPSPRGGTIFNRNHWRFYRALPTLDEYVISVDCTFKDLVTSDYVAIHVWGRKGADKYLLHRTKEQLGFAATVQAVRAVYAKFPKAVAVLIEDKANGSAVIETLKSEIAGVLAITPQGGKVARAYAMQPEQEAGNIWLPDPSIDAGIEDFIGEASSFPSVPHDDETDAMTQAINWYRVRTGNLWMIDYYREQVEDMTGKSAQNGPMAHDALDFLKANR